MNIIAVTQARIGSTRLPEKILKEICNRSLLSIHLARISKSKLINSIIVATTHEEGVERIVSTARSHNCLYFQGSTHDVLDRFYNALVPYRPDYVVRLTSDCPLIDPELIDQTIQYALDNNFDYVSNAIKPTFPDGLDVEVIKWPCLSKAWSEATLTSEREHVTPYIWKNSDLFNKDLFRAGVLTCAENFSDLRLTVDTQDDFLLIKILIERLGPDAPWQKYVTLIEKNPELLKINNSHKRNEGYQKSLGRDE